MKARFVGEVLVLSWACVALPSACRESDATSKSMGGAGDEASGGGADASGSGSGGSLAAQGGAPVKGGGVAKGGSGPGSSMVGAAGDQGNAGGMLSAAGSAAGGAGNATGTGGTTNAGSPGAGGSSSAGSGSAGSGGQSGSAGSSSGPLGPAGSWTLDFQDEFNGSAVDEAKWQMLGKLPWRQLDTPAESTLDGGDIVWRPQNASVTGGVLQLSLQLSAGTEYSGGLISLWSQKYGFYEARVKFVGGFPAWWITANGVGDTLNPTVDGTEMDIAESRAFAGAPQNLQHAVHWNGYGPNHQHQEHPTAVNDGDWHVFGFWWTTSSYRFYVDGVLQWTFTDAISHRTTQYMALSMGHYVGGQTDGLAYWDYVRHWSGG